MKEQHVKSRENRRPRFGVLDAVIVLLIITVTLSIYFRYTIIDWLSNQRNIKDYHISFAIDNIRYTTPNYMNVGDQIYFENGDSLGTLVAESDDRSNTALNVTPSSETFVDDGKIIEVFYPNNESRVDAKGRMLCRGVYSEESGFMVNGSTHLSAGQTIAVKTELVSFELRIVSIDAVK